MKRALTIAFLVLRAGIAQADEPCPVTLGIPEGWHATYATVRTGICHIDLSPNDWSEQIAKSRWNEWKYAVRLVAFSIPYNEAASYMGFERDRDGRYYLEGRQSERDYAQQCTIGDLAGIRSEPWFRGFPRTEREKDVPEQERLYSGSRIVMLLEGKMGLLIGAEYNQWSPDIKLDRDAAAREILKTIEAAPNTRETSPRQGLK